MKINVLMCIVALAIGALAGYGFWAANSGEAGQLVMAIGSGVAFFVTLGGTIAVRSATGRGSIGNIRVVSALFFAVFLVEQIVCTVLPFHQAPYIVVTGVLLLVYVVISYSIAKALE
jgi:hypothetical protein